MSFLSLSKSSNYFFISYMLLFLFFPHNITFYLLRMNKVNVPNPKREIAIIVQVIIFKGDITPANRIIAAIIIDTNPKYFILLQYPQLLFQDNYLFSPAIHYFQALRLYTLSYHQKCILPYINPEINQYPVKKDLLFPEL